MRIERSLTPRIDWFRILADLQYHGCNNTEVAEALNVPQGTLRGWKEGSEPRHHDGQRLMELWQVFTNRSYDERPMTDPFQRGTHCAP